MTDFSTLGLDGTLLAAISEAGYHTPTPIQARLIPAMLAGHDVVGLAQTGTGKTAAFVLPLLEQILEQDHRPPAGQCRALIIAPTRELAGQIHDVVRSYARHMRLSSALLVGGVRMGPQIKAIARGADILVATPGRLIDHMESGHVRLDMVACIVLDEADQMMDMGFLPAIKRIMAAAPQQRQTALLSATMAKPIRQLAAQFLHKPVEIAVSQQGRPADKVEQLVIHLDRDDKREKLRALLSAEGLGRAVVFTRTKYGAEKLAKWLQKTGIRADAIHGDKSQAARQKALRAFKSGQAPILVATDIAARGIDVSGVSHVINFELPVQPEAYVHRIGRTARAGEAGVAFTLCSPGELDQLIAVEKLIGKTLPAEGERPAPKTPAAKQRRPHRGRGPRPQQQGAGSGRSGDHRKPRGGTGGGKKRAFGQRTNQGADRGGEREVAEGPQAIGRRNDSRQRAGEQRFSDRPRRSDRPQASGRSGGSDGSGGSGRSEASDRPSRKNQGEHRRADQQSRRTERHQRYERAEAGEPPARKERDGGPRKANKANRPHGKPGQGRGFGRAGSSDAGHRDGAQPLRSGGSGHSGRPRRLNSAGGAPDGRSADRRGRAGDTHGRADQRKGKQGPNREGRSGPGRARKPSGQGGWGRPSHGKGGRFKTGQ